MSGRGPQRLSVAVASDVDPKALLEGAAEAVREKMVEMGYPPEAISAARESLVYRYTPGRGAQIDAEVPAPVALAMEGT